jgi:multiple sugar transport system permease protein
MSAGAVRRGHARPWLSSRRGVLRRAALYGAVCAVCAVVFFPVYWMIVISIRPTRYTINYPPNLIPEVIQPSTYVEMYTTVPIGLWLRNSAIVGSGIMLITIVLSVLAGYAFSAFRWRGRGAFGLALLVTQMLPEALLVIPIFVIFRRMDMIDTLQGVILAHAAFVIPVSVWILKGFFDTIPDEVREAARVDGCTELGVLWRIMLPLSAPAVVTVAVIAFFDGWNEYLFASTFITSSQLRVTSAGLASFIGELSTPLELVLAGATMFAAAPIVFFVLMQRYIVAGLTGGAIKG